MDLDQLLIIILSVFMVLWFFAANIFNRRRGIATYHWLRSGLEQLGKITQAQWIGSSGTGAGILVENATKPLRRVEAIYLLERREFLPLWVVYHLQGKRDEITLNVTMQSAPKQEIEIGRTGDREFSALQSDKTMNSYKQTSAPEGFKIFQSGSRNIQGLERLRQILEQDNSGIQRITLQRKAPHLVLKARVIPLINSPAESFFSNLQAWLGDLIK